MYTLATLTLPTQLRFMCLRLAWWYQGMLSITTRTPVLRKCDEKARGEWLFALDEIEALHPHAVVAGHGVLEPDSSPRHIEETRRYIRDLNAIEATTSTALGLSEKMLALHANRVNPGSLWQRRRQ